MHNNLKDLYVSYPFMPVASAPSWFRNIKFLRVTVVLPAGMPNVPEANGDYIQATLTAITASTAYIRVRCPVYSWNYMYEVPVFTGEIPTGNSYVYTDETLPESSGFSYRIHPSCLVFQQIAPALKIEGPAGYQPPVMQLTDYNNGEYSQWLYFSRLYALADGVLRLANGNNVEVSGSSDSVLFTGTPGAGRGIMSAKPYAVGDNDSSFDGVMGKGLKSINGHTGNVLLQGTGAVVVEPGNDGHSLYIRLSESPS